MSATNSLNEGRIQPDDGMREYRVVWEIDLSASSPRAAAELALEIHRDPTSIATVFIVDGEKIDLGEE